jgi:hypothetical protein
VKADIQQTQGERTNMSLLTASGENILTYTIELKKIKEIIMNKADCVREKISSRVVGFIFLPFALIIAFAGFVVIPILGVFFALPVLAFAIILIAAPESKVCRLITNKIGSQAHRRM